MSASDDFRVIYRMLNYLESVLGLDEPDFLPLSAEVLGIDEGRRIALIEMLVKSGYIDGVVLKKYIRTPIIIASFEPQITLQGLEYLRENSLMKQAADWAKGIAGFAV